MPNRISFAARSTRRGAQAETTPSSALTPSSSPAEQGSESLLVGVRLLNVLYSGDAAGVCKLSAFGVFAVRPPD